MAAPLELLPPGGPEAQRRLRRFAKSAIYDYADGRDQQDVKGTAALTAYLHFGMISARSALQAARPAAAAGMLMGFPPAGVLQMCTDAR